jgi:hypothetical protein
MFLEVKQSGTSDAAYPHEESTGQSFLCGESNKSTDTKY